MSAPAPIVIRALRAEGTTCFEGDIVLEHRVLGDAILTSYIHEGDETYERLQYEIGAQQSNDAWFSGWICGNVVEIDFTNRVDPCW